MSTILLAEDMAIFREPIDALLKRDGYQTVTAADGQEAIALLNAQAPDLVLLDLRLPKTDGLQVLSHIRASPRLRHTPVIVLSAHADRREVTEAARLGVSAYLLKSSFSLAQLIKAIRRALDPAPAEPAANRTSTPTAQPTAAATEATPAPAASSNTEPPAPADPAAALRSIKPILTRAELLERVERAADLKALSPTVTNVIKLTSSAHTSIDAVARAIAQDQAIALKVLKLANSSVYTRGDPVDSVHKAVVRIGIAQIRQAVLNIAVVDRFANPQFDPFLNTTLFWEHSLACGVISSALAQATGGRDGDAAFTMGLLHDVGRVIYAQEIGEQYLRVLQTARSLALPLEQVETRMLILSHADVMDRVLHLWNFPKDLTIPIVLHHLSPGNARSVAPQHVAEIFRLGLANRLAHALLLGSSGNDAIYPTHELVAALNLSAAAFKRIAAEARQQTNDMKLVMLSAATGQQWPDQRTIIADRLGTPLRPLFISPDPDIDGYRLLCESLTSASGEEDGRPNIALCHISSARDIAAVSARLRSAEADAGVANLPLIALSPAAKFNVEDSLRRGRAVALLSTPFTVDRFIAAAQTVLGVTPQRAAA